MQPSIPAKEFVNVIPSVLQAGAANLAMNSVFLTTDPSIPIGTLQAFGSAADVQAWFGAMSAEAALAAIYFAGYNGAQNLPSVLYFAQYNTSAVAAYLRGGALTGVSLTDLQGLSGTITIVIDGRTIISDAIDLSSATSFSNAAALVEAGLQGADTAFVGTGSQALGVLTISAVTHGAIKVGDTVTGAGVFGGTATVNSFGTGTGGAGTYNVSTSGTATSGAVDVASQATCDYDSQLNAFVIESSITGAGSTIAFPTTDSLVTGLFLTSAKGAVLSEGAAIAVPSALMNSIVAVSADWASFMNVVDPDNGAAGGPIKLQFSEWVATQNDDYVYIGFDSDPLPSTELSDPSCYGALVADLDGTIPIWSATQGAAVAAFVASVIASISYNKTGGRTTLAYRASPAVVPDVTSLTTYLNLKANGYNSYCNVATRTTQFQWFQPGSISGDWAWIDPYIDQIYWNARFQNDFAELLTQVPSIPYTQAGYNQIRQALMPDIVAMGEFGAWRAGVVLSGAQQVAVNTAAGLNIAGILNSQGWYLQITDPGPAARATRSSPNCTFWYTDGGSVQSIVMASIDIE